MILFNAMEEKESVSKNTWETFLKILAPFTPYFSEELWHKIGNKKSIHIELWPQYDPALIQAGEYDLVIQINGKTRDRVAVSRNTQRPEIEKMVLGREQTKKYIGANPIKKIIFVEGRLINIVV